jgi:hypothetical protein
MDTKTNKTIKSGTVAELSQLKAQAADALSKGPNADAQEVVDAVNEELQRRASAEPKKIRVRAKEFVMVDGRAWQKDQEGQVTEKEYAAFAVKFAKIAVAMLLAFAALFVGGIASAQQYQAPVNIGMTNNVPNKLDHDGEPGQHDQRDEVRRDRAGDQFRTERSRDHGLHV